MNSPSNKLTQEQAEKKALEKGFILISKYNGVESIVTAICPICKKEFKTKFKNIRGTKAAKSCGCVKDTYFRVKTKSLKHSEVEKRLKEKGFELLSIYSGNRHKITTKCPFCQKIFQTDYPSIIKGHTTSCGCNFNTARLARVKNEVLGKTHGLLTALEVAFNKNSNTYYKCQCKCGKIKYLTASSFRINLGCGNCLLYKNGKRCSKLQLDLFKSLNRGVLNFRVNKYLLDIAFVQNNHKICIEYDSWYWHQYCIEKDKRKIKYLLDNKWKCLIIKSMNTIAQKQEIIEAINKLLYTNTNYIEIVMKGWEGNVEQS